MSLPSGRSLAPPAIALGIALAFPFLALAQSTPASLPAPAVKHPGKPCVPVAGAVQYPGKDICVSAHVYNVVELSDGIRFLDVCPPGLPDDQCQFTLLSLPEDRNDVGDLRRFRDQDVEVRGFVRATHGRMGIVISHLRQFSGGPEKFRPNPKLLRDFNGQSSRMPVHDPNLASSGHHRSFMNREEKEELLPSKR